MNKLNPAVYLKAIFGGILAGLGVLYIALSDDRVTAQEAVAIATATLTTFASVWGVPNAPVKNQVSQQTVTTETVQVDPPAQEVHSEAPNASGARG